MFPEASKDHTNSIGVWMPGTALNTVPSLLGLILKELLGAKYSSFQFTHWEVGREETILQGHTARGSKTRLPNPRQSDPRVQTPILLSITERLGFAITALLIGILVFDYEVVSCTGKSLQTKS